MEQLLVNMSQLELFIQGFLASMILCICVASLVNICGVMLDRKDR